MKTVTKNKNSEQYDWNLGDQNLHDGCVSVFSTIDVLMIAYCGWWYITIGSIIYNYRSKKMIIEIFLLYNIFIQQWYFNVYKKDRRDIKIYLSYSLRITTEL